MIVTAQKLSTGIQLDFKAIDQHSLGQALLTFKQAETLAYTMLKMVEKHNEKGK